MSRRSRNVQNIGEAIDMMRELVNHLSIKADREVLAMIEKWDTLGKIRRSWTVYTIGAEIMRIEMDLVELNLNELKVRNREYRLDVLKRVYNELNGSEYTAIF